MATLWRAVFEGWFVLIAQPAFQFSISPISVFVNWGLNIDSTCFRAKIDSPSSPLRRFACRQTYFSSYAKMTFDWIIQQKKDSVLSTINMPVFTNFVVPQ